MKSYTELYRHHLVALIEDRTINKLILLSCEACRQRRVSSELACKTSYAIHTASRMNNLADQSKRAYKTRLALETMR